MVFRILYICGTELTEELMYREHDLCKEPLCFLQNVVALIWPRTHLNAILKHRGVAIAALDRRKSLNVIPVPCQVRDLQAWVSSLITLMPRMVTAI